MTQADKREFIRSLIAYIQGDILANVKDMPEEWDGIELRRYIAEKFKHQAVPIRSIKRARDYNNTIITRNL